MLNEAGVDTVSFEYETADGTAMAPADYTSTNGTLSFAPGETSKTVSVTVVDDSLVETMQFVASVYWADSLSRTRR
jgi:hypothetical protein